MKSVLRIASIWRRPFWWRVGPGRLTGAGFLLLPAALLLPLEAGPIVPSREAGATLVAGVGGLLLAFRTTGAAAVRDDALLWLYQKGRASSEVALATLLLDLGLAKAFALWWALAGSLLVPFGAGAFWGFLGLFFVAVATFSVTSATIFALGAAGARRPNDLAVVVILVSLLLPVMLIGAGPEVQGVLRWVVPPFRRAAQLAGAIQTRSVLGGTEALLHILLYCGALVALGMAALSRWRPKA